MEKVKYEYWKLFKIANFTSALSAITFILSSNISSDNWFIQASAAVVLNIAALVLIFLNKISRFGVFFSPKGVLFVSIFNNTEFVGWKNLKLDDQQQYRPNVGNYFKLSIIDLSSNKKRYIYLNDCNIKSFHKLLEAYSPSSLELKKAVRIYSENKISDYWKLALLTACIVFIIYFRLPIYVK